MARLKFLYRLVKRLDKSEFSWFIVFSTINLIFLSIGAFLFYFEYYQNYIWYHKLILLIILFIIITVSAIAQVSAIDALAEKGYRWKEAGRGDGFRAFIVSFFGFGILILFLIVLAITPDLNDGAYLILHIIFPGFYSLYPLFTYLIGYNQYLEDKE